MKDKSTNENNNFQMVLPAYGLVLECVLEHRTALEKLFNLTNRNSFSEKWIWACLIEKFNSQVPSLIEN